MVCEVLVGVPRRALAIVVDAMMLRNGAAEIRVRIAARIRQVTSSREVACKQVQDWHDKFKHKDQGANARTFDQGANARTFDQGANAPTFALRQVAHAWRPSQCTRACKDASVHSTPAASPSAPSAVHRHVFNVT
jgi:hypothetical protein